MPVSGLVLIVVAAAALLAAAVAVIRGFHRFRSSVRAALDATPDIRVTGFTSLGLAVSVSGHPLRRSLLQPFLAQLLTGPPTSRGGDAGVIADAFRTAVPAARIPPLPLVRDRILPVLKRTDRLPPAHGYVAENRVVRAPFDGEVILAYVIEGQFQVTFVTEGMLRSWTLDSSELHAMAVANLRAKTEHLLTEIDGPRRDYLALDGFDAARLLVADLLIPQDLRDPVLTIPHEHALLIRPSASAAAMTAEAERLQAASSLPLTTRLYRWTPAGPVRADSQCNPVGSS